MSDVTLILKDVERGRAGAASELIALVYDELRKLAAAKLTHESAGQTLDATALVHEAYLRLVGPASEDGTAAGRPQMFDGRAHFFAAAAEAMRRILIDNARRKKRIKHGGEFTQVELTEDLTPATERDEALINLDEALTKLTAEDAVAAKVVELRYFTGLGHEQVATTLSITVYEARQKWTYARAWLRAEMDR